MYVCIVTSYNLGKLHKTSMNFHLFRNDALRLKTLNFTHRTSNLMQCPHPFGLGIKSNRKMGKITFMHLKLKIKQEPSPLGQWDWTNHPKALRGGLATPKWQKIILPILLSDFTPNSNGWEILHQIRSSRGEIESF